MKWGSKTRTSVVIFQIGQGYWGEFDRGEENGWDVLWVEVVDGISGS